MVDMKDWVMVSHLRQDCRVRLTSLSRKMGMPISTLYDRLRDFEGAGVLRHSALLDFAKLGFQTRAVVLFSCARGRQDALGKHLTCHPNVNSLFRVNNGFCYLAECVFRSIRELESFTDKADGDFDGKHQTYFVVDDVRREGFLSDPELVPLAMGG
jgi:DNA-binding Lrp family transcriptional regulator